MSKEIELKFLVDPVKLMQFMPATWDSRAYIRQGYLSTNEPVVRVRIASQEWPGTGVAARDKATITVKGPGLLTREEVESVVDLKFAADLFTMTIGRLVCKTRYRLGRWEIDAFHGHLEGLVMAEIELNAEDEKVDLPDWLTTEVTNDPRYSNVNLATASAPPSRAVVSISPLNLQEEQD